jgi:hypothetical protein
LTLIDCLNQSNKTGVYLKFRLQDNNGIISFASIFDAQYMLPLFKHNDLDLLFKELKNKLGLKLIVECSIARKINAENKQLCFFNIMAMKSLSDK